MLENMSTTTPPRERATLLLGKQWCGYPVDPFLIAAREGITVRTTYTLPDDVAGALGREHAGAPIHATVNGHLTPHMRRVTMARILGHYTRLTTGDTTQGRFGVIIRDLTDL